MANLINSLSMSGKTGVMSLPYAVCGTAAGTAAKTITVENFSLEAGAQVMVKFTYANTASSPTLNVNSTGAKSIVLYGTTAAGTATTSTGWQAGAIVLFTYDGASWVRNYWDNTTYTFNGAVSTIKDSNLTASRALISNSSGKVAVSDITATELGYLDNVTSNIQTQLNARLVNCAWNAIVTGQTWSRLCYVAVANATVGCSFILNVAGTRSNVVYNDTYLIHAHHSQRASIVKLNGTNYTNGNQVRALADSTGNCYVELYDSANSITTSTTQTVYCRLSALYASTVTTYTSFTTGATLPNGFAIGATLTTTSANIQGTFEGSLTGPATKLGASTVGGSSTPIYLNAGAATAFTSTIGNAAKPVYLNSGAITACSSTIGGTAKPVYMNAGTITAFSSTIGGAAKPVYLNAGTITAFSSTIGGSTTPVYVNGGTITACTKSFDSYLPLSGGTVTGATVFSNTTASASSATGAVRILGGLGVAGQVSVGTVSIGDEVTLEYNSTAKSLDFIFSS